VIAERYELVRMVGQGGIGQVWLAKSQTLHNDVALKLFLRNGPGDGAERLLAEARAAAALEHPAIVRVFDYGETVRGDPFLVMEHLKGESLDELLQRVGPLQPSRALRLLLPLVAALSVAHGKQVIHRDIKPGNLFLAVDEAQRVQPKLIDFGLARLQRGGTRLTQAGVLVGSPAYMSPEQISDKDIDARTDLWSLCVVLHELVTGQLPFVGDTQYEMFKAILEGHAAPLPVGGEVDEELIAILHRGLAKDPADRFSTARELGKAFASWLVAHGHEEDVCGASLQNEWLRPRKISSLAPPTPAIAFIPPGLVAPIAPRPSAAALAPTQAAIRAPSIGPTSEPPRPRRRWVAPLLVVAASAIGFAGWMMLRHSDDASAAISATPSASASSPAATASTSAPKKAPSAAAPVKAPTAKPTATTSAKPVKPAPSAKH
jgi:serine/threonine-protein kinase